MYEVYIGNILFPVAPEKIVYKTKSRNSVISLVNDEEISRIKTGSLTEYSFDVMLPGGKRPFGRTVLPQKGGSHYALVLCITFDRIGLLCHSFRRIHRCFGYAWGSDPTYLFYP